MNTISKNVLFQEVYNFKNYVNEYFYFYDSKALNIFIDDIGNIIIDDLKIKNKLPSKVEYEMIINNSHYRLEYMYDLLKKYYSNTHEKYVKQCITCVLPNKLNEKTFSIVYKGKEFHFESTNLPFHHDNVEMLLIDYDYTKKIIVVFDFVTCKLYMSTISNDVFEVDDNPYSINLFIYDDDLLDINKYSFNF